MANENLKIVDQSFMKTAKGFFEGIYLDVNMYLRVYDKYGKIKEEKFTHNTVTTAGKNGIADQLLAAPSLAKMGWIAVGTGTPGSSALGTEIARVALTTKTRSGSVITMSADFAAGVATGALTEAGVFDAASTGNMWMSSSFGVSTIGASDYFTYYWQLSIL